MSSSHAAAEAKAEEGSVGAGAAMVGEEEEQEIRFCISIGGGIAKDIRRRGPLYVDDWRSGMTFPGIFAPATYVFFASVLPALTFGEQFRVQTEGQFSIPHIVVSTALGGFIQSIFGREKCETGKGRGGGRERGREGATGRKLIPCRYQENSAAGQSERLSALPPPRSQFVGAPSPLEYHKKRDRGEKGCNIFCLTCSAPRQRLRGRA